MASRGPLWKRVLAELFGVAPALPDAEADAMAELAAAIREHGYMGFRVPPESLDRVLIYATSYRHMVALLDTALRFAEAENRQAGES